MKKSLMLALAAASFMSLAPMTGHAASAPTYDDQLIVKDPVTQPTLSDTVLIPVASPQVVEALHDYVVAWQHADEKVAEARAKYKEEEKEVRLTKADRKWLHSQDEHTYASYFRTHSIGRVHGYEVAMNWNGENRNVNDYHYFSMPGYNEEDGFTNSYGFNVLRGMVDQINTVVLDQEKANKASGQPMTMDQAKAVEAKILDIMSKEQEHVSNEELRHYMNETVWFAAKETVKNKASEEPTADDEHVVDLKAAMENPNFHKVDLRKAINK